MSKAFTSEEADDPTVPGRRPEIAAPPRPITAGGHASLVAALAQLETALEGRPGDESLLQRRALTAAALASVVVTPPRTDGLAGFDTDVTLERDDGTDRRTWRLVGPDEAQPSAGRISVESPIARALLGAAPGDEVELGAGARVGTFVVVAVVPGKA